jgi:cytochrome c biogenesis protein CcmG/thiol:disulfide interchange protein DsbE
VLRWGGTSKGPIQQSDMLQPEGLGYRWHPAWPLDGTFILLRSFVLFSTMSKVPRSRRLKSSAPYAVALLGAGAVVLLAWLSRGQLNPVIVGSQAPAFTAVDEQGTSHSWEDYRGKVLLVNIWATWCVTCKEEMPAMQRLYEELAGEDFEILAVSVDATIGQRGIFGETGGNLWAYADSMALTFPILHSPSQRIAESYQITGVPESFVIDRHGLIMRKVTGPAAWDAPGYVELIRRLLSNTALPRGSSTFESGRAVHPNRPPS